MSIITIVGAGMMGSALSVPACDNGHTVRLVGTHLDRDIIESVRTKHWHPTMRRPLPAQVEPYQLEELDRALEGADLLLCGVSSFGVDWFAERVLPRIPESLPVLSVTKGMVDLQDGTLQPYPRYLAEKQPGRALRLNAIGGPCTSYELADRRQSTVAFCGDDPDTLRWLRSLLGTEYYHITCSTDVTGVECAVAMKNAYALAVSLAVGLTEAQDGEGCTPAYNPQAALFGQSVREMTRLIELTGGRPENIVWAAGDLYVTIFGGRTRRLGTLLGRGLTIDQALAELEGVTLESVVIAGRTIAALHRLADAGRVSLEEFPLLLHIDALLNGGQKVDIPWKAFERDCF